MRRDPDTAHRPRRLLPVLVVFVLVLGACSSVDARSTASEDDTAWIGATTWLVEATVTRRDDRPHNIRNLDLEINGVLFSQPTYWWLKEFPTPELRPGDVVRAELIDPSTDIDLVDRHVFVALQAAGEPGDLSVGVRAVDGRQAHAIIMLFDPEWNLIEVAGGLMGQFSEVYALYGKGKDAVVALIEDAAEVLYASNRSGGVGPRPSTPGPLGEWRRALGVEGTQPEPSPSDRLEAWLVDPPEVRQLFVADDEVIPGADAAVGVDGWVQREVVIGDVSDLAAVYPWVGLRFAGVGVLGPFGLRTDEGPETGAVPLFGYFPVGVDAELVGWRSSTLPDLAAAEVIATVPVAVWDAGESVTVAVVGNDAAGFTVEPSPTP